MKTRKILALALALVMVFSLSVSAMAFYTDEELEAFGLGGYTPNEIAHDKVSRDVALESYVLMRNNGVLPIAKSGKIALFGNGATGTIKGGSGSGIVNQRERDWIDTAFEDAGYEITTPQAYRDAVGRGNVATGFSGDREARDVVITDAWLKEAMAADTAIYVLARTAGEGSDRQESGSGNGRWLLYDAERENLEKITANFKNVIVVLNTYITDISWLNEIDNIDAVLHIGYGGQKTGLTTVQVLNGTVSPSGKTNATWAWELDDYLSSQAGFSWMDSNTATEVYDDGIYVGYRYFDTFGLVDEVAFPFGFGLSYTDFDIAVDGVDIDESDIVVNVTVTNTGDTYSGKEVVQVYFSAPDSEELEKPYQELAAFAKTDELAPGQKQSLAISFKTADMASYSEKDAAYVLDAGDYIIRVGNCSRNTHVAAVATVTDRVITEQLSNQLKLEDNAPLDEVKKGDAKPITYAGEADEIAEAKKDAVVLDNDTLVGLAVNNASPYDDETATTYLLAEDYDAYVPRENITLQTNSVAGIIQNRPEPEPAPADVLDIQGSGRYVRLNFSNPATNYGVSFYELTVNAANGMDNISKGKPATASSIQNNSGSMLTADLGVDGNNNTRWGSDYNGGDRTNPWYQVDLGQSYMLEGISILFEAAYARNVEIQLSDDGVNFTTVKTATVPSDGMKVSGGTTQRIRGYQTTTYDEEKVNVGSLPEGITKDTAKLTDVMTGKITLEQFVACLSIGEMARLVHATGQGSDVIGYIYDDDGNIISYSHGMKSNMARSTADYYATRHIPALAFTDGPAGLRCDREGRNQMVCPQIRQPGDKGGTYYYSTDGGRNSVPEGTEGAVKYSMYPTAFPASTNIACTWNTDCMYAMGEGVGKEMREYNVNAWLAPGINIQRNPMCGRNFEYYSEDPYLSGISGGYTIAGVQSSNGVGACLKHYWGNNQENARNSENNVVSERAAREIYLKGYEIAIKLSQPMYFMTSYNENNGWPSADNFDACTDLARGEWGFNGIIMTDWGGGQSSPHISMHAGNDFICPGKNLNTITNYISTEDEYNKICLGDLQKAALHILNGMMYSQDMEILVNDLGIEVEEQYKDFNFSAAYDSLLSNGYESVEKSDISGALLIEGGKVEADNTETDTVEVPVCYTGDETVTSVRVQLSSELPIVGVTSSYETFAYNPDNGKVVVSHPDGVSGVLFTVTLDISDESLKAGKYPVDIEIIEVTDDTGAVISAAAADGEVDLTVAVVLGDVNQDGIVDNRDLIMIARYLVDLVSFSYDQKLLADFNQDGNINNTDLVLISRALVA